MLKNDFDIHKVWHCFTQMQEYKKNKPLLVTRSDGKYIYDDKDQQIYDGVSSLLSASFGHNNPYILKAMKDQLDILDNNSLFLSTNLTSIDLATKLCELTNHDFNHIFFTNSGSEAVETAIKIAKKYMFHKNSISDAKIIAFENCYHGSTIYATLLSGHAHDIKGMEQDIGVIHIPTFDVEQYSSPELEIKVALLIKQLKGLLEQDSSISIIITELIQLSNGATVVPPLYFEKLRELCDEYDVLWIADEVATGFGRTGDVFAYQSLNVKPDILLLGKAISGGHIPLGAVCVPTSIYETFLGSNEDGNELTHGFTTSGHPLACRAALAAISYMEQENIAITVRRNGEVLKRELIQMSKKYSYIHNIQGKGLLLAINFIDNVKVPIMGTWGIAQLVAKRLLNYGLLLYPDGDQSLIIAPPLTMEEQDVCFIVDTLDRVLKLFGSVITNEKS